MQSHTVPSGPELRGSNINLDAIKTPSDVTTRKTKIICTMGPACWDVPTLEALIKAGMNVARFNFSHGDHEGHKACLDRVRQAAKNMKKHVGEYMDEELHEWMVVLARLAHDDSARRLGHAQQLSRG
jgi:pyruvate kinase